MGILYDNKVSLAFDVHGCPQACKHCWLGPQKVGELTFDEAVSRFRSIKREQTREGYYGAGIEYFGADYREPHCGDNYRSEYAVADKINGVKCDIERNFELVSLWRLNRDPSYPAWCRERGIRRAQVKVFGGEQANNFFIGRRTAHEETLRGAEILLEHGILPRFQIYLNRIGIDTIPDFLAELKRRGILDRIEERGARPQIHCMTYGLQGFGRINRRYAIDLDDVAKIPEELLASTAEHFGKPLELCGEAKLAERILAGADGPVYPAKHWLWFFVDQTWDVYPNLSEMHAAWRLGNLRADGWRTILRRYVDDEAPAAKLFSTISRHDLVRQHRGHAGQTAFMSDGDLLEYYLGLDVEKMG